MTATIPPAYLLELANQYGLPLFVYDAATIRQQIETLQSSFHVPKLEIRYACKALNTIGILKEIYNYGCGMDTVSPAEILMALEAGVPATNISFTPSGVSEEEYAFALSRGTRVHVDQIQMLEWLDKHFPGLSVTLRFNPGIRAGGHEKLQVGSTGSKFGFSAAQVEEVKKLTSRLSLKISGVHMHLGSDIGESESFDQAYEYLLSLAGYWKDSIDHVDLGGGFKVPYHPQDHAIDIKPFGQKVSERFVRFCKDLGRDVTMVLEPGKFLVSAAGHLLMQVTGVRETNGNTMAYVSSGFNHFLRPMSYGAYHHILNLSNPTGAVTKQDVVGYLCETDTFATARSLPEIRKGDVLCLLNAGAYGFTMASNYNARPRPAEVLIKDDGTAVLIRRAETIEDVLRADLGYNPTI